MNRTILALTAVAGLTIGSAAANAQTLDPDVRCLVLSNLFSKADPDPKRKQFAALSAVYYLGRIDARLSPDALKTQLAAQANVDKATAGPLMNACGKEFQEKERNLVMIGQSLVPATPPAAKPPVKKK